MELREIATFLQVAQLKSFSKAAQNLYISQPSLSARIKKAEETIGFPIFDRSTSPLQLTEVGEVYIKAVEEIFRIEQHSRCDTKTVFIEIAVWCSSCFVSKETREGIHIQSNHVRHSLYADILHIICGNIIFDFGYPQILPTLLCIHK